MTDIPDIINPGLNPRSNIIDEDPTPHKPCPPLLRPKNGKIIFSEELYKGTRTFIAEYTCDPGYILKGTESLEYKRRCSPRGAINGGDSLDASKQWSGKDPWCKFEGYS